MTVDDDADLQVSIVDVLEDKGFCPVVAADGLEALDLLQGGFRPSVILLDLRMPRMDGWNFLGGHLKTGHGWTGQNRPPGSVRDW